MEDKIDPADAAARAEALYDDFLRARDRGERSDLEALCRAHPDLADLLRVLHAREVRLGELLPGAIGSRPATAILGSARDPLEPDLATTAGAKELLGRLAARGASDDRFRERVEVARGAMGVVYSAFDGLLRRRLALKFYLARPGARASVGQGDTGDPEARSIARFLDEAQITSQLDHPGIVPVHDIGLDSTGRAYFAMRFVRGSELREVLELARTGTEGWSQVRVLGVLLKVCEAMSYAHRKGVIHRDLKPSNIMVGRFGEVYVMDWGLAKVRGSVDRHDLRWRPRADSASVAVRTVRQDSEASSSDSPLATMDGDVVGTPAYMSPEQALGDTESIDERSDVYSVGALLYQLIAGEVPFVPAGAKLSPRTILARVIDGPPKQLEAFGRSAPVELVAICEQAMARDRADRYASMDALADDLRAYLEQRVVSAYEGGTWAELRKWLRRNRALASAIGVAVVASALVAIALVPGALDARRWRRVEAFKQSLVRFQQDSANPAAFGSVASSADVWIARAKAFVAELPTYADQLEQMLALEASDAALPPFDDEWLRIRRAERTVLEEELAWCDRMLGDAPWRTAAQVDLQDHPELHSGDPHDRNRRVFPFVRTDEPRSAGFEELALRLAEELVLDTEGTTQWHPRFRDTLAFARFRVRNFSGAIEAQKQAIEECLPEHGAAWPATLRSNLALIEELSERWRTGTERPRRDRLAVEVRLRDLELRFASRRSGFGRDRSTEVLEIVQRLVRLQSHLQQAVRARNGLKGYPTWERAIAAIEASEIYEHLPITPQLDLVPLGPDAHSGLWEFVHLPSGEPPIKSADGVRIRAETGIVFVLLPPGFLFEEEAVDPAHGTSIRPFFLSKHELGEQQWLRILGDAHDASIAETQYVRAASMSWVEVTRSLSAAGGWLCLPTSAQWEYGCRGGTVTPWWTGTAEQLAGAAVLQLPNQAPVGVQILGSSFREFSPRKANPFGLHDTHGNVKEWCSDGPPDELVHFAHRGQVRYCRGGSCGSTPDESRSDSRPFWRDFPDGNRLYNGPWEVPRGTGGGVRPARPLMP